MFVVYFVFNLCLFTQGWPCGEGGVLGKVSKAYHTIVQPDLWDNLSYILYIFRMYVPSRHAKYSKLIHRTQW